MNLTRFFLLPLLTGAAAIACFAQPNRIASAIDATHRVALTGRVHPLASAANDAGAAASDLPLFMTLLLKPSSDQQTALAQLTQDQQNPGSPRFRQWLTPEQYADQFGASAADISKITTWLQSQGFTMNAASRSRTFLSFSGTAGQVQRAFGTPIHRYQVNGALHYANAGNPQLPSAFAAMVAEFRGLNDFHPQAQIRKAATHPDLNFPPYGHVLAPSDFAAIYDIGPMYSAGINGSGQSIVVVGQSALYGKPAGSDITSFWNKFGITTATLTQTLVPGSPNPGVQSLSGDVDESSLDIEWATAVARNATVVFVYSTDVWTSAVYAVDQNLAPVISMSYGECEMADLADLPGNRQVVQQANAEGITWLAAAGDQGAAACDFNPNVPVATAEGGLAVSAPASIPEVTAMGGTMFNDNGSQWSASGGATGYIPESTWNEYQQTESILGTGGGASLFFPQPSWQSSIGVPNDGWRHVPDISFTSAVYTDPYYVYSQGVASPFGGTSAATPTMAGVIAMLNQYLSSHGSQNKAGLGNINPTLYRLLRSSAFHDITTGNNIVPCASGSPQCTNGTQGFSAGAGYDSTTGLGSVDVSNLIQQWTTQSTPAGSLVVATIDQNPVFQTGSGQWSFQLTLTEEAGVATTLTGFTINGVSQPLSLFGSTSIPALGSLTGPDTLSLASVPASETFGFSGKDASGATWSTAITVPFAGPQTQLSIANANNGASGQSVYAPGMIMAVYGTGMGTATQTATVTPWPLYMAGVSAYIDSSSISIPIPVPLWYVSANQVNLQIPYETPLGRVNLTIYTPYQPNGVNFRINVANVAPGIFTYLDGTSEIVPSRSASAGSMATMFITGAGTLTPSLADGETPAASTPVNQLPKPRGTVSVTVGGVPVSTTDANWFVGVPTWSVSVTQINFTIPAGVPSGRQPVLVTVTPSNGTGAAQSLPAYINIQ